MLAHTVKSAVITGASQGIGKEIAFSLAEMGIRVLLLARNESELQKVVTEIQNRGQKALALYCDVQYERNVKEAIQRLEKEFGELQLLINNAGIIHPISKFHESSIADWEKNIRINLLGPYYLSKYCIPLLLKEKQATLINISTGASSKAMEGWSAYCSAKAGLSMLSRCILEEYPQLRVFSFRPGLVDTAMQDKIRNSGINPVSQLKQSDLSSPKKIGRAVTFLLHKEADPFIGKESDIRQEDFQHLLKQVYP